MSAGRPDPLTLDTIIEVLSSENSTPQERAYNVVALSTVCHHPLVKKILANPAYEAVLRTLARQLFEMDSYANESRWEVISAIGELCRVEDRSSAKPQGGFDMKVLSKRFFHYFCNLEFLHSGLKHLLEDKACDKDVQAAASDIKSAFNLSPPGQNVWTREVREKCKDLMFLDASCKHNLIPFVSCFSSKTCANCGVALTKESLLRCSQCKAIYYCSKDCQVKHWKLAHKNPCLELKGLNDAYIKAGAVNNAIDAAKYGFKTLKLSDEVRLPFVPGLFYETRHYLYEQRAEPLKGKDFESYFMEYYTPF